MMVKMYGLGKQAYLNSSFNCFDCIVSPTAPHTRAHTHTHKRVQTLTSHLLDLAATHKQKSTHVVADCP